MDLIWWLILLIGVPFIVALVLSCMWDTKTGIYAEHDAKAQYEAECDAAGRAEAECQAQEQEAKEAMSKDVREILIELGNEGIKGSLKPNDYYNGKILSSLAELIRREKKYGKGGHGTCCTCAGCHFSHDDCECTRNEAIDHVARLFEKEG